MTAIDLARLGDLAGREVGVSDWLLVAQDRIDAFADATGDRQWIHVDAERARTGTPFGATIARVPIRSGDARQRASPRRSAQRR